MFFPFPGPGRAVVSGGAGPGTGLADGDPVASWLDSSTGGHDATQTGTARPTFKTNVVNGKPVVRFTSANSQVLNIATLISGAAPWSVLVVMSQATGSSVISSIGDTTDYFSGALHNSDSIFYAADRVGLYSGGGKTTGFHVFTSGTSPMIQVYDGGVITPTFAIAGNASGSFKAIGVHGSTFSDGDIAEILLYNVLLSGTDHANLEKYLGTKYGITVAGGTAVQPDTVSGLVGWWKADSLLPVHLLNTLVSYWKLDEASGTRNDSQGTNHLVAINGTVTAVTGKINNGISPGAAAYISVASNSTLQVTSDFTFSCWVQTSNPADADTNVFIAKEDFGSNNDYFFNHDHVNGWQGVTANNSVIVNVGAPATANTWYHLVFWYDHTDSKMRLRVNDTTTYVSAASGALTQGVVGFSLGGISGSPLASLQGILDEVGFWKRLLTAAEITALYNGGAGLPFNSFTT